MTSPKKIAAFYTFVPMDRLRSRRRSIMEHCRKLDLHGTIVLAAEGINGTICGCDRHVDQLVELLKRDSRFAGMPFRFSRAAGDNPVFYRMKVKIKDEIVALRKPQVDPHRRTGTHLDAANWNAVLQDPEVVLVDTRNRYEVLIGSFPGAVDPNIGSFREFPDFVAGNLHPRRDQKIAMFCTGGIRCEKASSYLLDQGFEQVYQLDGGILNYLATVAADENRWHGECFVFDQRVAVDRSLQEGDYEQCFACRRAIRSTDKQSPHYRKGVSCCYCYQALTFRRRRRFAERQRQVELAEQRGGHHIGAAIEFEKSAFGD